MSGSPLPRDFLDEVETELSKARRGLELDRCRITVLEDLLRVAAAVAAELDRPITVFDLVRSAPGRAERERRASLVRELRR